MPQMKHLRVIDETGNQADYEAEFVPRIGERIRLDFGRGKGVVRPHYYRVRDVEYSFDNEVAHQVRILVEEEKSPKLWPS